MYKWIKLAIDLLFLLISGTILTYLYLLNQSRPIDGPNKMLSATPSIVQVKQNAGPPTSGTIAADLLVNIPLLMEIELD